MTPCVQCQNLVVEQRTSEERICYCTLCGWEHREPLPPEERAPRPAPAERPADERGALRVIRMAPRLRRHA